MESWLHSLSVAESNQTPYLISTVALTSELDFKITSVGKRNKVRSWAFFQFCLSLNQKTFPSDVVENEELGLIKSYILGLYILHLKYLTSMSSTLSKYCNNPEIYSSLAQPRVQILYYFQNK